VGGGTNVVNIGTISGKVLNHSYRPTKGEYLSIGQRLGRENMLESGSNVKLLRFMCFILYIVVKILFSDLMLLQ